MNKDKNIVLNLSPEQFDELLKINEAKAGQVRKNQTKSSIMHYVKTGIRFLSWPVVWPYFQFKKTKTNLKKAAKDSIHHAKNLKHSRNPWAEDAPDMSDFNQVMAHWGIHGKTEYDAVVSGYTAQIVIFTVLGLWGAYLMTGPIFSVLHGVPLLFLGVIIVTTRLWRVQILKREKFVYFKDWFLWGMFAWIGRETPFAKQARIKMEGFDE